MNVPRIWKIFRWVLLFFLVFSLTGFLIAPPVAKFFLKKTLSEKLHREVVIQDIDFNPYSLSARVSNFLVKGRDNTSTLLSFDELYVNLQIASLIKKGLIFREARLDQPYINVVRLEGKTYNISDLMQGEKKERESESAPLGFSLNNIQILNGSIDFIDGPKNTKHKVRDIRLTIPVLSNLPYDVDIFVQPLFQAKVNDSPILLQGKTKPFHDSLETVIDLDMKEIDIPYYLAYFPFPVNFKLLSGRIDGKSNISYTQFKDRIPLITVKGDLSFQNLKAVDKDDNPLIHIPIYILKKVEINLSEKKMSIGEASSMNGIIDVRRSKDGTVNVRPQLPELAKKIEEAAEKKEVKPWIILLKKIIYYDYTINVKDSMPPDPVGLVADDINLRAENISTEESSRGSLSYSFKLNNRGSVSAEGSLSINPVAADVALSLKDIDLAPFQPYITDKIKILITGGLASADGNLSYVTSEESDLTANFKGTFSLSKFASLDKLKGEDFLKWDSLYLNGIDYGSSPFHLNIGEVSLTDFYSKIVVNPDGTLNVQGIAGDDAEKEPPVPDERPDVNAATEEKRSGNKIKIDTVTLQAGMINFSDQQITPSYSANLREIGGRVSGLSSEEESLADLDLRGKLENYAPLEITGKINPLRDDLFVDLSVDFKDMDLSPLTPYSNKYIGYTIRKGKLSLGLTYLIVEKKLKSQNKILLDQFTLGDRVESPDATTLPVKLAIALLKNRKGEINLDLPVSGNIDDPKFSISSVVLKMITSILLKAATSPFALLGAIVGGGEELSYIEFDYGKGTISDQEKKKLDKLTRALSDRPQLNIDIGGYVDTEKDREELRQTEFMNKLKAQKSKEIVITGQSGILLNEVTIAPEEYELYLGKAYEEEEFPKPRNTYGTVKKLPPEEMEKLMLTYIQINEDDLRLLASKRSLAVKEYILQSGQVDPKRIFLIEPQSLQPEEKKKLRKSRVEFTLK